MPSEAEKFLGIDPERQPRSRRPLGWLGRRSVWLGTLAVAYLLSIGWLGGLVVCVPYVIVSAPLGLTSLFYPPANPAEARVGLGPTELMIHAVFWSLFTAGLIGCRMLPLWIVRLIFLAVLVLLALTEFGCARFYHFNGQTIN